LSDPNTYSDLTVSYTQRKIGRQVVALQFKFGPKAKKPPLPTTSASAPKAALAPAGGGIAGVAGRERSAQRTLR
jgi:hypothetical protein